MSKRPTGFGKASKQKKLKQEDSPKPEENQAELNIELVGDVDDEELAEIYSLYIKLQEERDPKIARGLIHECDGMLRARDAANQVLPDKFHVVYGGALLTLADPSIGEDDPKQFRDAGVERINVGLTSADEETVATAVLELVQYAHTQLKDGELTSAGQKILKHAVSLLKKRSSQQHVELGKAAFKLLQLIDEIDISQFEFTEDAAEVARKVLQAQVKSSNPEIKRWGHKGLGQYYLNLASPALADLEDESEDEESGDSNDSPESAEIKEQLNTALTHLRQCLSESDQDSYVMLAETLLSAAGLDDSEDNEKYAEALRYLKKARLLGNDTLNEVIESLEATE